MELEIKYMATEDESGDTRFSLGEVRSIINQQESIPDEAVVNLRPGAGKFQDAIIITWDEA